ncbi:DUF6950 family protein [Tabrizicola oligotrophica]|uniref:DUF6950 family protein n=1 Tax=Tabrizicola oligotrophica TaxID=2710650 RepID=UPI00389A43B4
MAIAVVPSGAGTCASTGAETETDRASTDSLTKAASRQKDGSRSSLAWAGRNAKRILCSSTVLQSDGVQQMSHRSPGWERHLTEAIVAARDRPFRWGRHDCATFAFDLRRAIAGSHDVAALWRGRYTTGRRAAWVMRRLGWSSLEAAGRDLSGRAARIRPSRPAGRSGAGGYRPRLRCLPRHPGRRDRTLWPCPCADHCLRTDPIPEFGPPEGRVFRLRSG